MELNEENKNIGSKEKTDSEIITKGMVEFESNAVKEAKPESKKTMNAKTAGIISYLSIVGWIIAYMAGDKEGAKFHMNQALVLNISSLVLSILSRFGRPISYIVCIAEIGLSILWIIAFISAIKAEEKKVPLLGEIQILK